MRTLYFLLLIAGALHLSSCSKDGISGMPQTGQAGSLARFTIVGNYLYALDGSDIVSYNITAGNAPVFASRVKVNFDIETLYGYNNTLFIGAETAMYAYSLENPATPKMLSVVMHVRACDPVVAQGKYAYVTLRAGTRCGGTNLLNVYDVSNLTQPLLVKTIGIDVPVGLGINGNALYVTFKDGIKLFDITQPHNPVFLKDIPEATATDVIPYTFNNTLLVQLKKGAAFYDISSSQAPTFLSRINQ